MASFPNDRDEDLEALSPEERERVRRERGQGRLPLDKEIARRYDPATLARLVVNDAGRGEPLEANVRGRMERMLGGDFRSVRVVRGPVAEEFLSRHRADAAAIGGTELILVKEGPRANFQSAQGTGLLAHELTHVQQQRRGLHFKGEGSEQSALEHEAEQREVEAESRARGEENERKVRRATKQQWVAFWRTIIEKVVERQLAQEREGDNRTGHPIGAPRDHH